MPLRQLIQVAAEIAPTVLEYFPATQDAQLEASDELENLPAGQAWHELEPGVSAKFPAVQAMQVDSATAPVDAEALPTAHLMQESMEAAPVDPR